MILINGKSIAIELGKSIELMTLAYNHTQILIMPTNHSLGFYQASISKSHNLKQEMGEKKELFRFLYFEPGGNNLVAQQGSPCLCKKAVRHHRSPSSVIVVQTSGRGTAGARGWDEPQSWILTPAPRETVLQQFIYIYFVLMPQDPSRSGGQRESRLLLGAVLLQQKVFGCCSSVVKLTPVFLCCDLGKRVSRDVLELCCSSCFPWSSHFVCVCVCASGREAEMQVKTCGFLRI